MFSIVYVVREKGRATGGGTGFTSFFQEEIVFMLSAMMHHLYSRRRRWEWNWRIETNVDERK